MRRATLTDSLLLLLLLSASLVSRRAAAQSGERALPEPRREGVVIGRDAAARDTVVNVAAAVPAPGTVRVSAAGGADRSREDGALGGVFRTSALWSIGGGVAAEAGANIHGSGGYPDAALRWHGLRQERAGIDLMTAVRYGTFGTELRTTSGGQIAAQIALGRSFGRLQLLGNALVARGLFTRTDIDAFGGAAALVEVVPEWRIGLDGRARTEVEDTYKTEEDEGRAVELKGGLLSAHRYGPVYVQILGGWQVPRGLAAPGPVVLATAMMDF